MRRYYFLAPDSTRDDLQALTGRELGGFDGAILRRGRRLDGPLPDTVRLVVPPRPPADLLGNALGWTIVSERLYELIKPLVDPADYELVVPHVFIEGISKAVSGYLILNPLRFVKAMVFDRKQSRPVEGDVTFDVSRIPIDAHLFRPTEQPLLVCMSNKVVDALSGKGLQGVVAIKTQNARQRRTKGGA